MQRMRLNPFFDGEAPPDLRAEPAIAPAAAAEGTAYLDASRVNDRLGRPMSGLVPQGVPGLRNVVIPHATDEGVPIGNNPHRRERQLIIDPHLRGESSVLDLDTLTPAGMAQSQRRASEMLQTPARDVATRRLHGAAAMHVAAGNGRTRRDPRDRQDRHHTSEDTALRQRWRDAQPAVQPASFFGGRGEDAATRTRHRALDLSEEGPAPVSEPEIAVIFERQDQSRQQAWYHDVKVERGFLVLIFDTRYRGPRYMPAVPVQSGDGGVVLGELLAINIGGSREVYFVAPTPFVYLYESREHSVLLIREQAAIPGEESDHGEAGSDSAGDHAGEDGGE